MELKTMDAKKTQQFVASTAKAAPLAKRKSTEFVDEIKTEFKKVNWTSREELQVYTKLVVGATFVFGMSIYVVDLLIQTFLGGLGMVFRLISG